MKNISRVIHALFQTQSSWLDGYLLLRIDCVFILNSIPVTSFLVKPLLKFLKMTSKKSKKGPCHLLATMPSV